MAVGKSSILRAANAGNKTSESVLVPAEEVMKMVKFMASEEAQKQDETLKNKPVPIRGKMPAHLL